MYIILQKNYKLYTYICIAICALHAYSNAVLYSPWIVVA